MLRTYWGHHNPAKSDGRIVDNSDGTCSYCTDKAEGIDAEELVGTCKKCANGGR